MTDITVVVSGHAHSGKSTIMKIISDALDAQGISNTSVSLDGDDYTKILNMRDAETLQKIIEAKKFNITIKEMQTARKLQTMNAVDIDDNH
jgi:adenylylsulfate kinase-like enzyme